MNKIFLFLFLFVSCNNDKASVHSNSGETMLYDEARVILSQGMSSDEAVTLVGLPVSVFTASEIQEEGATVGIATSIPGDEVWVYEGFRLTRISHKPLRAKPAH